HADANDWTLAGATADDLQAAMKAGKPVKLPAVPVAKSNRADIAREYLGEEPEPEPAGLPPIIDATDFMATPQPPPRELVSGMLHQGSKLVLGGGSKSFKTWTLLDLALSVSHGLPWLGRDTICGRVLYLNFEIQNYAWQKRIAAVARAKEIELKPDAIKLWNLRGHAADFKSLLPRIESQTKESGFALIILDPIYKLYGRTDENKAGDVAALLNGMESLAVQTGAAVAFGAHFSKGNQSQKEAIDRISGSGVFARDPDSILIFTKHEETDAFTVESILRNFAPVEPFAVRWNFPLFELADELDPAKLKQAGGRKAENAPDDLLKLLPADGLTNAEFLKAADEDGISKRTFYRLRKSLEKSGRILLSKVSAKWTPVSSKTKPCVP
ncbi:MAG TPA: AAA family ATPase, partial [Candidatus Paceibacterota bacterium]|nr:AAA family ATPase [Candidatus Paceibacterota bacterium]